MSSPFSDRLDRRTALKWMATAATSLTLLPRSFAQTQTGAAAAEASGVTIAEAVEGTGYGTDPALARSYAPGDFWPLTFDDQQRRTAAVLCGLIIPADTHSPSAADVKVHDFIDEWISSPYPGQAGDREVILNGLGQLDQIAQARYRGNFADLRINQQARLCDELARMTDDETADSSLDAEARNLRLARRFFRRFRDLTAGGFYTTPEGMKDVGYLGNVPIPTYPEPPAELLQKLGLT